jgi:hypothetical protein
MENYLNKDHNIWNPTGKDWSGTQSLLEEIRINPLTSI